jgi:hypothetical protein
MPTGNDEMRSTAFLTSCSTRSVLLPRLTSTSTVPLFSRDTEVTRSTPVVPRSSSSILSTMPSSTSSGLAPGYTA